MAWRVFHAAGLRESRRFVHLRFSLALGKPARATQRPPRDSAATWKETQVVRLHL